MNYYEILYVVNPNHGKDKISEIIGEVSSHIESKKHAVVDHNFWEKKALAYPVKSTNMETIYYLTLSLRIQILLMSSRSSLTCMQRY